MAGNGFEVRRLSGSIGAEILGIDLASEPGDNVIGEIRQVWLEHNVIFFRDQDLPPAKFLAFAKRFGASANSFASRKVVQQAGDANACKAACSGWVCRS